MKRIFHERNTGRGRAVSDGFEVAEGEVTGYIDVDLEVHARYIPSFFQAIKEGADVAIGKRIYKFSILGTWRYVLSVSYARMVRSLLPPGPFSDTEAGYKFFQRDVITRLVRETESPGWFWDTEVMIRAQLDGFRIVEIPCLYVRGFNKQSTVRSIPDSLEYLGNLLAFRRRMTGADTRAGEAEEYWKNRAAEFAGHYEGGGGPSGRIVSWFLSDREKVIGSWMEVGAGCRVLDAGCGHGPYLLPLARKGATVTGLDVSREMLEMARGRLAEEGLEAEQMICAPLSEAPLSPGSYDLVLAIGLLDYLDDFRAALAKLASAARPGGRVIFTVPKRPSPFALLRAGPGLWLRKTLFGLPPVLTAMSGKDLEYATRSAGLGLEELKSCWGAMWMARCRKE
jgi:SAM-dependent methyltransferase